MCNGVNGQGYMTNMVAMPCCIMVKTKNSSLRPEVMMKSHGLKVLKVYIN